MLSLDGLEQSQYMASLIHACISDDELFDEGMTLIEKGQQKGLFENVKLGHHNIYTAQNGQETESTGTPNG